MREYRPYTPERILRKEEGALYVFFEQDKALLLRNFSEKNHVRDNGPVLDEIMEVTAQILSVSDLKYRWASSELRTKIRSWV